MLGNSAKTVVIFISFHILLLQFWQHSACWTSGLRTKLHDYTLTIFNLGASYSSFKQKVHKPSNAFLFRPWKSFCRTREWMFHNMSRKIVNFCAQQNKQSWANFISSVLVLKLEFSWGTTLSSSARKQLCYSSAECCQYGSIEISKNNNPCFAESYRKTNFCIFTNV